MAAILDALAPYVKKMITNMAEEEVSMLLGVSRQITELEANMESIKDFLYDAERRCINDKSVQRWVRKLKSAMYDTTDILDLCQLKAYDRSESKSESLQEKATGCFQPLLFCLRNPMFAHRIGRRIKELNQRLDAIHKEAHRFKFDVNLSFNQHTRKPTTEDEHSSYRTTSEYNEFAIVGKKIEEDANELVQLLITQDNNNPNIKVVSVVGTGGMGKTTLAQKIFKENTIEEHFKMKIWLSITQHFDEIELLRAAINHAGGNHGGEQDKSLLTRTLTDTLSTGRFLLVLDDVWTEKAWDYVLSVPIINASQKQQGNRVLVTTRLENLVPQMRVSFHQHHVSPLGEEDAWSLLKKQLPLQSNKIVGIEHLKNVGLRIIEKCGGLPLAVKVMGGLLSTRCPSEREWEAVLNSLAWSIAGLPKELDNRIYLSYEDLSPQLKQCFLYCSLFPKGTNIRQCEIIPMWISEGFIEPWDGKDDRMEEVATEYYRELITRNLIEPKESYFLTGYKCTMHDVVRSFAQFMAREESLVLHTDEEVTNAGGNKDRIVRRLSIGLNKSVLDSAVLQKKQSLRTLIINHKINFEPSDLLSHFSSLRSLLIKDADCDRFVNSLCLLRHLRYLHLEDSNISRLPDNIHRMKLLQHIVLDGSKNLNHLPRSIIQLVHLRTLDMNGSNVSVIPKGFGGLTNLRTLYGFPVHMNNHGGSWCSLEEIAPLSQLRDLTVQGLENLSTSSMAEKARISSKGHLSYLRLNCIRSKSMGSVVEIENQQLRRQAIEEAFDNLCPPTCIEDLAMKGGYYGHRLPKWMMVPATSSFQSLRYLTLIHLHCCTQLPDGLCQLPTLESLDIEDAPAIRSVGPQFQANFSMAVGGGVATASPAFPSMTKLCLEGLCKWEEWDWEEQGEDVTSEIIAMPALVTLIINNCQLQCLPQGLANSKRFALRILNLYKITNLTVVENFSSVVKFYVFDCPKLKRISRLTRLQKVKIVRCLKLEVLEDVPKLDRVELEDTSMAALPAYLRAVKPRYLKLKCSKKLFGSLSPGSSEWDKISHIEKHNISYIDDD